MSYKKMSESSESSECNNTFEVDAILADRYYRGIREFRVRWFGFPPEEDTWQSEASLDCPDILKAYLDKKRRSRKRRKPKRGVAVEKRKVSRSPAPGPPKDETSFDDVFDISDVDALKNDTVSKDSETKIAYEHSVSGAEVVVLQGIPLSTDLVSSTSPITSFPCCGSASSASNIRSNPEGIPFLNPFPPAVTSFAQPELNPPIIKEELSEISIHFSSTSIALSVTDECGRNSSGTVRKMKKTRQKRAQIGSSASTPTIVNAAASDISGSSRQSSRIDPTRATSIVFEDPTRFQPSQPIVLPLLVLENVEERSFSHKCFTNGPTVFEYAQENLIQSVKCQKIAHVLAKRWKLRCPECTQINFVTDCTVEYAFCHFTENSKDFLMIKLANGIDELYSIEIDKFRIACPMKYASFTEAIGECFKRLEDVQTQIEEEREIVETLCETT